MTKSLKQEQQDIDKEIAEVEAELTAMGEHAPQEVIDRIGRLKDRSTGSRVRLAILEKKYARVKREAERAVPAYQAMTVEMPKWRTTILLALNSAAIVAVIGKTNLPASFRTRYGSSCSARSAR